MENGLPLEHTLAQQTAGVTGLYASAVTVRIPAVSDAPGDEVSPPNSRRVHQRWQ